MTQVRLIGGTQDGRVVEVRGGIHIANPLIDREYQEAFAAWFQEWGITKAWHQAGHSDEDYEALSKIPPEPSMPVEIYEWKRIGDELVAEFTRIER